jgi:energy-converting hydrogenase Eha subunit G
MSIPKDSKEIINTLYHATVESLLIVGYVEISKKLFKKPPLKLDLNLNNIGMLTIDLFLAMITKDMLVKNNIIPADIMN